MLSATPVPPFPYGSPPKPSKDYGAVLAARQADILLYLGAFLLGCAALIFVNYQGDQVSPFVQFFVLLGYTIAGTVGGILLRRWERVREAGHVFLGLGALLVPLNFAVLYTNVFGDGEIPGNVIWFAGSVFCGIFYGTLAWRGFGWLYRVPAALAVLSLWTSVGSLLSLPLEWNGAWHMIFALGVSARFRCNARRAKPCLVPGCN